MTLDLIINTFKNIFNQDPLIVVRSPGRINLIGEHTYYNKGFVLPAAIDKEIILACRINDSDVINLYSTDFKEKFQLKLLDLEESDIQWVNYLLGIINQFINNGYDIKGFDLVFGGNIPQGAGLGSSAAIESGFAKILNTLFNFEISDIDLIKMAHLAEHEFNDTVFSSIMDYFSIIKGKANKVIKLDCNSHNFDYAPFETDKYQIMVVDTKIKQPLATSEYSERRKECLAAVEKLQELAPGIKSLRDINFDILKKSRYILDDKLYRRTKFIVEENERVEKAFEALLNNDIEELGRLMIETHIGLRDDYEVSSEVLNVLFDVAVNTDGVIGARMMGGGFGGSTINIVASDNIDGFSNNISTEFEKLTGQKPDIYIVKISEGTGILMSKQ